METSKWQFRNGTSFLAQLCQCFYQILYCSSDEDSHIYSSVLHVMHRVDVSQSELASPFEMYLVPSCWSHLLFWLDIFFSQTTQSQNHRMVGVGRDLCGSSSPTPAKAGTPTTGCTGPCPGGFWISPEKETPQPPWAACSRAPSPSKWRSSSSCSDRTSYASVCAHCPLSSHWAPLKRVWPHPLKPSLKILISISKVPSQPAPC